MLLHNFWHLQATSQAPMGDFLSVWDCGAFAFADVLRLGGLGYGPPISGQDCADPYFAGVGLSRIFVHFLYTPSSAHSEIQNLCL